MVVVTVLFVFLWCIEYRRRNVCCFFIVAVLVLVEAAAAAVVAVACMKRVLCDRNLVGCVECDTGIYMR